MWHHGIAKPKPREKRLVESSDVDDTFSTIEALERSEWHTAVAELAGIVVFDDPGARLSRPGKKLDAARHRQCNALWELVRGRDESRVRSGSATDALGDIETMLVDRYWANLRACRNERKPGQGITWIFDPNVCVSTLHDAGNDIDSLLRARSYYYLFWSTLHSTRDLKIVTNGVAQVQHALRIAVTKVMLRKGSQRPRGEFTPDFSCT